MSVLFISYSAPDRDWAEWLAKVVEGVGHRAIYQARDFGFGGNFVIEMQLALEASDRTIAVLSQAYLKSKFCSAEWAAVFATDPDGTLGRLVPLRIDSVKPTGLLRAIQYVDLAGGMDSGKVLAALSRLELLPTRQSGSGISESPPQLGAAATLLPTPALPTALHGVMSERDRSAEFDRVLAGIKEYFARGVKALRKAYLHSVSAELTNIGGTGFELSMQVKAINQCRMIVGQDGRRYIRYTIAIVSLEGDATVKRQEGVIASETDNGKIVFLALDDGTDEDGSNRRQPSTMTPLQVAEFLWSLAISGLEEWL